MSFTGKRQKTLPKHMNGYKVIVTKSTVPVGTGKWLRNLSAKTKIENEFRRCSNPEFLREGAAIGDFMRPDRVVIGSNEEEAIAIMKDLYRPLYLIETPIVITSLEAAELTKYAANAFLATKITFINEIANLCDKIGCDVHDVARGMGMDKRIGRKFLHPGPGIRRFVFSERYAGFDDRRRSIRRRNFDC
jgi:UDPglucose 6-dehydrogenase